MSNKRDIRLDEFNISDYAYRELRYFCLQYPEKKKQLKDCYLLSSHGYRGAPSAGGVSDPTSAMAMKAMKLSESLELIEQTAIAVDSVLYPYIIKNVTTESEYRALEVPCGRRQFYELRRKFFYLLALKRGLII
ncbi:MAG: hypothetical protein K0S55_278 [Clostridia bacterium]|nr:hypothetical protein [Clostridia bacterium]